MTIKNRIGLAASIVLSTLALSAVAAPVSAAWWGDGRWHDDDRWRGEHRNYYGYHYREPPVIYSTPYNYGYYAPPVIYDTVPPRPGITFTIRP